MRAFPFSENASEAEIGGRWCHLAELVSLFDGPTKDNCFAPCASPSDLLPFASFWGFCDYPDFDRKWFRLLGSAANGEWRHHAIPLSHFCLSASLTFLVCLFPLKIFAKVSFGLAIALRAEVLSLFCKILDLLKVCAHQQNSERHILASNYLV
jgi:hypothetical protein